jgi:hypothetical protein
MTSPLSSQQQKGLTQRIGGAVLIGRNDGKKPEFAVDLNVTNPVVAFREGAKGFPGDTIWSD